MKALILAGGLGTRLRPVINDRPKPMAPFGEEPFLEFQIRRPKEYGVRHFVLCVGYLYQQIESYFEDGRKWGVHVQYSIERELLGTGGAIQHAHQFLHEPFLVLNGDSYLDLDPAEFVRFHKRKRSADRRCLGSLVLTEVEDARPYGSVDLSRTSKILSFSEKTSGGNAGKQISAGIYLFEPEVLGFIPAGKKSSLERDTFPAILKSGFHLFGFKVRSFFADIGSPPGFRRFQDYVRQRHV